MLAALLALCLVTRDAAAEPPDQPNHTTAPSDVPVDPNRAEEEGDHDRYVATRKVAVASTAIGGALFAAGIGAGVIYEVQCAGCDTRGFGVAGVVFGAWGTIIPMTVAGVELTRMNHIRRDNGEDTLTSSRLVLPSVGVTAAAFSLYPIDGEAAAVGALLQVGGASFALVNAFIALERQDPFDDAKQVGLRLEPLAQGGAIVSMGGPW